MSLRSIIVCFSLLALPVVGSCREPVRSSELARNGVLDLRQGVDHLTSLSGEWKFYPGRLLKQPDTDAPHTLLKVPGHWNAANPSGPDKAGTYHLRVLLPRDLPPMALRLEGVYTGWAIFVNGEKLMKSGVPALDPENAQAGARSAIVPLPAVVDDEWVLDLVIQVSNFDYREGGIRKPVRLGSLSATQDITLKARARDIFLAGALIMIGLYHFSLIAVRKRTHAPAFLALHCMAIAIRPLTTGEEVLLHLWPEAGYHFYLSLEYLSLPLSVVFFLLFLRSLFPGRLANFLALVIGFGALPLVLLPLFLSTMWLSRLVWLYQLHLVLSGIAILGFLVLAVIQKKPDGLAILLGGIPLFLGVMNDVLSARGVLNTIQIGSFSLVPFVLLQSALLSVRFARSFNRVEQLSEELQSKNKELRRLDELKDEFLANTSHELRTPLHGIIGITESVLQGATGKIGEQTRTNLRLVAASGRRLTALVNDILDFSRANHGDLQIHPQKLNLADAMDMALSLVRPLLRDKPVDLIHERSVVRDVYADPERLSQIMVNLLGNAIKFTRDGYIAVRARDEGDSVVVSVEDTGIGIPEDRQEMIFESFTQADGSIARQYSGTGLGLSITRRLVELHGGDIQVQSSPGKGSVFSFSLPAFGAASGMDALDLEHGSLNRQSAEAATRADFITAPKGVSTVEPLPAVTESEASIVVESSAGARSQAGREPGRRFRTLVVDDDPVNLQVLRNLLSVMNHEVLEANSGTEALTVLEETGTVDLVLLDLMMPGLTGYEVCRILRESHSPAELPIVLLTARSRTQDVVEGLASGANDYLAKPFEPEELRARVQNMVALKEAARTQANMAVIQHELATARMIQQSLIPARLPGPSGIRIAHVYRSMVNVGGDYYDYLSDESGLSLLIADVSGHGVPAALIVSVLKMAYTFQRKEARDPSGLLTELNSMLYGNVGQEFITACAIHIDPGARTLRVANAGHPPVLHWKASAGTVNHYRPFGRPMGILEEGSYQPSEFVTLESGDRILLYTDGAFEASAPDGEPFGMERLEGFLANRSDLSLDAWLQSLLSEVMDYSGGPDAIDDDIALIALEIE